MATPVQISAVLSIVPTEWHYGARFYQFGTGDLVDDKRYVTRADLDAAISGADSTIGLIEWWEIVSEQPEPSHEADMLEVRICTICDRSVRYDDDLRKWVHQ